MDASCTKLNTLAFSTVIPCAATLVGAGIAYFSAVANNRKNLFVNTITQERAEWRRDLRIATSELARASRALATDSGPSSATISEHVAAFHANRVAIKLRVNPSQEERHSLDQRILVSLAALAEAIETDSRATTNIFLDQVENDIQALLTQEWERSKIEAQTGDIQTGDMQISEPDGRIWGAGLR